jgi:hypothetical protein
MDTLNIRILHPTDSTRFADGDADLDMTLRDLCVDLKSGEFLPADQDLTKLGATLERTNATLPMLVPLGKLGIQNGDAIALARTAEGA